MCFFSTYLYTGSYKYWIYKLLVLPFSKRGVPKLKWFISHICYYQDMKTKVEVHFRKTEIKINHMNQCCVIPL